MRMDTHNRPNNVLLGAGVASLSNSSILKACPPPKENKIKRRKTDCFSPSFL